MTEIMTRIVVGLLLAVVGLLLFVYLPEEMVFLFLGLLGYGMYLESYKMTYEKGGHLLMLVPASVPFFLYFGFMLFGEVGAFAVGIPLVLAFVVMVLTMVVSFLLRVVEMLFFEKRFLSKDALCLFQFADISCFLVSFFVLYMLNKWWLLTIIGVVVGIDTVGYFVGRFCGRTKAVPSISPNKTIEGYVGALVWVVLFTIGIFMIDKEMSILPLTLYMSMIYILSIIGDLLVSYQKRLLNVKDSGVLLPGHGGLLDRLDSWVFVLVFCAISSQFALMIN